MARRRQVYQKRNAYRVARPIQPMSEAKGMQMVRAGGIVVELVGLGVSRLFDVKPQTETKIRHVCRVIGEAYGESVAKRKTQEYADYMNRRFGHLKVYAPPFKPYTVDMREPLLPKPKLRPR